MRTDPSDPKTFEDEPVATGDETDLDSALDTSDPVGEQSWEVSEADAVEQHRVVPLDEDEYRQEEPQEGDDPEAVYGDDDREANDPEVEFGDAAP